MIIYLYQHTDKCGEWRSGEGSECTESFASLDHIDMLEGNLQLVTASSRQVLIPDVNFTCNGTISKWIVGADWQRNAASAVTTFTELQIWRSLNPGVYTKVGKTTLAIRNKNSSGLYEYPLQTPLVFQEGDVLAYYQPLDNNRNNIDLYLETPSSRNIFFYNSGSLVLFDVTGNDVLTDNKYPLIAVETGNLI